MHSARKSLFALASAVILLFLAAIAQANTIHVPGDQPTIQAAIYAASAGDTIVVAAGTYHEALFWFYNDLTIQGAGPGVSIIDPSTANGGPGGCCLTTYGLSSASHIQGFTIQNGNTTGFGGGMANNRSSPTVSNCIFSGNMALRGGGMSNDSGSSPTVTHCIFTQNTASGDGGGMDNLNDNPNVSGCTFSGNMANSGGGMDNDGASPTIMSCTFTQNKTVQYGGGMSNNDNASPTVTGCSFTQNTASNVGGGMYNNISSPTLTNCTFSSNTITSPSGSGAGIYNGGGSPTLTNCIFSSNTSANDAGGMDNEYSNATVAHCTFTQNTASSLGGGMVNNGVNTTIIGCIFRQNRADQNGGGMNNSFCDPTVTNCAFYGNTAGQVGGGMFDYSNGVPIVTNCIFSGNTATEGAGMYNQNTGALLTNCTFSGNAATYLGGGLKSDSAYTTVTNCILWGDTAGLGGTEVYGYDDLTYSDEQDIIPFTEGAQGDYNLDPLFVRNPSPGPDGIWGTADDDYGDLHLQSGSTAIDTGNDAVVTVPPFPTDGRGNILDFSGNLRTSGLHVDMGAYEYLSHSPLYGQSLSPPSLKQPTPAPPLHSPSLHR